MSDFQKFIEIIIHLLHHMGRSGIVIYPLLAFVMPRMEKSFICIIVVILLFVLTIILGIPLYAFGIIMACLLVALVVLVKRITYNFDIIYFVWVSLLCGIATILGLIGKFIFHQNPLYAILTTILLIIFSMAISLNFLEHRGKFGEPWKFSHIFLHLGTTIGICFILYPKLFFFTN